VQGRAWGAAGWTILPQEGQGKCAPLQIRLGQDLARGSIHPQSMPGYPNCRVFPVEVGEDQKEGDFSLKRWGLAVVCSPQKEGTTMLPFTELLWSEEGQDIAEYAVMLAVILVLVVGTIRLIGSNANSVFSQAASSLQ